MLLWSCTIIHQQPILANIVLESEGIILTLSHGPQTHISFDVSKRKWLIIKQIIEQIIVWE